GPVRARAAAMAGRSAPDGQQRRETSDPIVRAGKGEALAPPERRYRDTDGQFVNRGQSSWGAALDGDREGPSAIRPPKHVFAGPSTSRNRPVSRAFEPGGTAGTPTSTHTR